MRSKSNLVDLGIDGKMIVLQMVIKGTGLKMFGLNHLIKKKKPVAGSYEHFN